MILLTLLMLVACAALIFISVALFALVDLLTKRGAPTQMRQDLIAAIDTAIAEEGEIIWPQPVKDAFDKGSVKSIGDIL